MNESFSYFLSSSRRRGGYLRLPFPESRTLKGKWKACLKDISFKRQDLEVFTQEPIYFLLMTNDDEAFRQSKESIKQWKKSSTVFNNSDTRHYIASWEPYGGGKDSQGYFKWNLVYAIGDDELVVGTPKGAMTIDLFTKWVDSMLYANAPRDLSNGSIQFEHDQLIFNLGGNRAFGDKSVVVLPIFGPNTRKLLGLPDPETMEFAAVIKEIAWKEVQYIAFKHRNKIGGRDLVITCNVLEPNAVKRGDEDSDKQLRVICQGELVGTPYGHPSSFQYPVLNEIILPVKSGKYNELVVKVIEEDTGEERELMDSVRATVTFLPPVDDSDSNVIEFVKMEPSAAEAEPPMLQSYRKRIVPGDPINTIQLEYVKCKSMLWSEFIKPSATQEAN